MFDGVTEFPKSFFLSIELWNGSSMAENNGWTLQLATIHQEATQGMCDFNKICPDSGAKSSRMGVGQSSGELMGVAYCCQLGSKCQCSPVFHRWFCIYAGGWGRKMAPVSSLHFKEVPQHAPKSVWTDVTLTFPWYCVNFCSYVASQRILTFPSGWRPSYHLPSRLTQCWISWHWSSRLHVPLVTQHLFIPYGFQSHMLRRLVFSMWAPWWEGSFLCPLCTYFPLPLSVSLPPFFWLS